MSDEMPVLKTAIVAARARTIMALWCERPPYSRQRTIDDLLSAGLIEQHPNGRFRTTPAGFIWLKSLSPAQRGEVS